MKKTCYLTGIASLFLTTDLPLARATLIAHFDFEEGSGTTSSMTTATSAPSAVRLT